jgi:osmoprotectant transport system permease protein
MLLPAALLLLLLAGCRQRSSAPGAPPEVHIGAKEFAESEILGQILRHQAMEAGAEVAPLTSVGDTGKVWNALLGGQIDAYPEYTGTLSQQLLVGEVGSDLASIRRALARRGLRMSRSLGFSNSYGLGMRRKRAASLKITTISDLRRHPELKIGLSAPFLDRPDGWRALRKHYQLPQDTRNGMEHQLAYQALRGNAIDFTDVYTTDAAILKDDLVVLEDDRHFFPAYDAVILYRADLDRRAPEVVDAFLRLEGTIEPATMITLNARVDTESPQRIAVDFLHEQLKGSAALEEETLAQRVWLRTWQHVRLVMVSLLVAIALAVPLGILAARLPRLGFAVLAGIGIVQTIPALALLGLLFALLHTLGAVPAIVALFLYSLLPIVRNTYTGLQGISPQIRESAEALGLSPLARLWLVELPLASPAILAGIKTAAVVNVGYATLGGLIGAGGYGQPIMDGVTRDDVHRILEGAVPAVVMALAVQVLFDLAERLLVPRGLRLQPAE